MNRLTQVTRGSLADSFNYYWTSELLSAQYGGQPHMPFTEGQEPDLDTTDTVDPNAGYQPPDSPEEEPAPPADGIPPSDSTANSTPVPGFTPSDTPPAEDPDKEHKTVDDYVSDGNLGPEGPGQPDLPTARNVSYNLDKAGNRTSVTDNANGNATYAPNTLNQYTSVGGSPVGNGGEHEIQTYNNVGYTYINDERLKTVKTPPTNPTYTYTLYYDALGRCVKRMLNSTTTYYIYDGEKPILEYRSTDLSNPAKNVYGKGIDEILMRYDPSFNPTLTCYYQQDHEGSVTHLLSTSGNVIESYKYDAFGLPTIYDGDGNLLSSSAKSNRFLFTGREYANLFGFYEYRARAYHPTLGRFMSEDPKLFVRRSGLGSSPADWAFGAHPDESEFNLFRYCGNDPVDFTDPMGLMPDTNLTTLEARDLPLPVQVGSLALIGGLGAAGLATSALPAGLAAADAAVLRAVIATRYGGPAALAAKLGLNKATKLIHIFNAREGHTPPAWKEFGSVTRAAQELAKVTQAAVQAQGTKNGKLDITVKFGEQMVTVRGIVKDGLAQIGTAFVPKGVPPTEPR